MNFDDSPIQSKGRTNFARMLTVLVLLAIGGVFFLSAEHKKLIETCNFRKADPQEKLAACDTLLAWTAREPAGRSMIYRHKMRIYILQKDWDAALREADLAAQADPESPVPWHWKAKIFVELDDYRAALRAIDEALTLDPDNKHSLRTKYKLLTKLGEFEDLDELVSQDWANGGNADWLPAGEPQKVTWNPSQFPKSHAVFLDLTVKLRGELLDDLHNPKLRWRFAYQCMMLAGSCPPLLPEKRRSYPSLECSDVIEDYSRERPEKVERILKETEYQTLRDLFDSDAQLATHRISEEYVGTVSSWLRHSADQTFPSDLARKLIQTHNLFDCVSGGKFAYLGKTEEEKEELEREVEKYYNMAFRMNLLDLAHVYAN